jgi:hypothetical protein
MASRRDRNFVGFEGIEESIEALKKLPKNISHSVISNAAKKSAKGIVKDARAELHKIANQRETPRKGFSKALFVAKAVKEKVNKKRQAPGAKVWVDGPDIPVGDRKWALRGYAKLLGSGSYQVSSRKTRKSGSNRGSVAGFGNYVLKAARRNRAMAEARFGQLILKEMDRASDKTIKRYGKK